MPLMRALNIRPKSVLFCTDLSPESQNALRHALAVARYFHAMLHVAHVVSSVGFNVAGPDALACAHDAASRDLDTLRTKLALSGGLQWVALDMQLRDGDIGEQIDKLIEEDEADLVVIGTHGRHGLGRLLLGSVAERIFRCAPCPVVTVGPEFTGSSLDQSREAGPALFATDFHAASMRALPYLVEFARDRKVKLVLLHVVETGSVPASEHWDSAQSVIEQRAKVERETVQHLRLLMKDLDFPDAKLDFRVAFGEPAHEIIKMASHVRADVIGMGLHNTEHATTASHLRESTAYRVVCGAPCAVFTARS